MTNQSSKPSENFIKATIKIAHPDYAPEQIHEEYLKKLAEMEKKDDNGCEFCSS